MNISICTYKDISMSRDKLNVLVLEKRSFKPVAERKVDNE